MSGVAILEEREVYGVASERASLVVGRLDALLGVKVAASLVVILCVAGPAVVQRSGRGRYPSCCLELATHPRRAPRCGCLNYGER